MTKEEALYKVKGYLTDIIPAEDYSEVEEIIKALEQEPCDDAISRQIISDYVQSHIQEINTGYGDLNKHTNEILGMIVDYIEKMESVTPQPCGDVINRNTAIVQLSHNKIGDDDCDVVVQKDIETIKALPPVTPQSKLGHWIEVTNGRGGHECDICHVYAPSYQDGDEYLTNYCPSCGAKMFEPQESEE